MKYIFILFFFFLMCPLRAPIGIITWSWQSINVDLVHIVVNCQYSPKLYLGFGKTSINLMAERKQIAGCQNLGALVGNRQDTWVNTLFELNNTWEFHCYLHFSRASVLLIFFFLCRTWRSIVFIIGFASLHCLLLMA